MRNADLDDLKDEQYAEQVKQERKEVDAMPKTQTTYGGLIYEFDFVEIAKELAEEINRSCVKFDKASESRFLDEGYAAALIQEKLISEIMPRLVTEIRCQQTREIAQCQKIQ